MHLDLLVQRGDIVDVVAGRIAPVADIGVRDGRIVEVARGLDPRRASRVIDASGQLVTPGLVDMHTHVFAGGGYYGLDPAEVAWRSGVTTWIDAGSAGAYTLAAMRELMTTRPVRYRALMNISVIGLAGESYECRVLENCAVEPSIAAVQRNRDVVAGIKVRADHNTVGPHGLEPLRRARAVAEATGLPLMVHIGVGPPSVAEILALLRPGDVLTHCATGVADGVVDQRGNVSWHVMDAYARGVRLDLGHGVGGFSFPVMQALLESGCPPHTVSSDLHAVSVRHVAFDLPTVMTKMLAAGMELVDVVAAATRTPAHLLVLGDDVGTLDVGAPADIAVFERRPGPVTVSDAYGELRKAPERLVNTYTIVGGTELAAPEGQNRAGSTPTDDDLATPGTYARPG